MCQAFQLFKKQSFMLYLKVILTSLEIYVLLIVFLAKKKVLKSFYPIKLS